MAARDGVASLEDLTPQQRQVYLDYLAQKNVRYEKDADGNYLLTVDDASDSDEAMPSGQMGQTFPQRAPSASKARTPGLSRERSDILSHHRFPRFCQLIDASNSAQAKTRGLPWLLKIIEDIFDARHTFEMNEMKAATLPQTPRSNRHKKIARSIPLFVYQHLSTKYGVRALVHQCCWELLLTIQKFRERRLEVEIFARFLSEQYSTDDLLFYLFTRWHVLEELAAQRKKAGKVKPDRSAMNPLHTTFITSAQVLRVTRAVFGDRPVLQFNSFMELLDTHLIYLEPSSRSKTAQHPSGSRCVEMQEFLFLALNEYHNTRPDADEISAVLPPEETTSPPPEPKRRSPLSHRSPRPAPTTYIPAAASDGSDPVRSIFASRAERCLERAAHEYVTVCISSAGGDSLPSNILSQLIADVLTALRTKVHDAFTQFLQLPGAKPLDTHTPLCQRYHKELSMHYRALETSFVEENEMGDMDGNGADDGRTDTQLAAFSRAVLGTPDLRHAIEPLMAYLATCAKYTSSGGAPATPARGLYDKSTDYLEPDG